MPCYHKFLHHLELKGLDFEPTTLIVGTFNPAWPATNTAQWFYGRTEDNYFWNVLPRIYGSASLSNAGPAEWKQFCKDNKIALTDLISCIEDADEQKPAHNKMIGGFSDKAIVYNFEDHEYVNIVQLLQQDQSIKNIYLTRGVTEAFWRHIWNPVAQYCNRHGIRERKLLSPTDEASYHHTAYNSEHPDAVIPLLQDYILNRWRADWHFLDL